MTWAWWEWQKPEDRQSVEANRFGEGLAQDSSVFTEEAAEAFADIAGADLQQIQVADRQDAAADFAEHVAPDLAAVDAEVEADERVIDAQVRRDEIRQQENLRNEGLVRGPEVNVIPTEPTPDIREAAISAGDAYRDA